MQTAPDIQLPSLPEVTLRALEACHQDDSYRKISDIVSTDAALATRVLAVANSALYGPATQLQSIDQALLRLGTHRFQTLLLTAALRQMLLELGADQWQQLRNFWRLSLTTALTARALATLTRYPEPDQAFMLGMLHNIGELLALKTPPGEARQYYLNHQCDIAAELVRSGD
ncbi:MAG: HDOD domain-containing protein [Marinobacter sp.]